MPNFTLLETTAGKWSINRLVITVSRAARRGVTSTTNTTSTHPASYWPWQSLRPVRNPSPSVVVRALVFVFVPRLSPFRNEEQDARGSSSSFTDAGSTPAESLAINHSRQIIGGNARRWQSRTKRYARRTRGHARARDLRNATREQRSERSHRSAATGDRRGGNDGDGRGGTAARATPTRAPNFSANGTTETITIFSWNKALTIETKFFNKLGRR